MVFKCVEIRESHNSAAPSRSKSIDSKCSYVDESRDKSRRRSLSLEEACLDEPCVPESRTPEPDKKDRWFSWKSRRFSFKRAKTKEETRVQSASLSSTNSLQVKYFYTFFYVFIIKNVVAC